MRFETKSLASFAALTTSVFGITNNASAN